MEFPENIKVELIPSAELEKLRAEIAAVNFQCEARSQANLKLYYEVLDRLADVKSELRKIKFDLEDLKNV